MTHRTFRRRAAAVAATCATLAGMGVAASVPAAGSPPARSVGAATAPDVAALVSSMSLEEKVGQLFVTYAYGDSATTTDPTAVAQNQDLYGVDNGAQLVAKYHLGGVIYFTWANTLTDPTKIAQLSNGFQQAAADSGAGVPLLDQHRPGGRQRVTRIGAPVAISPGNMALGATGSPDLAQSMYSATGRQLKALGHQRRRRAGGRHQHQSGQHRRRPARVQ